MARFIFFAILLLSIAFNGFLAFGLHKTEGELKTTKIQKYETETQLATAESQKHEADIKRQATELRLKAAEYECQTLRKDLDRRVQKEKAIVRSQKLALLYARFAARNLELPTGVGGVLINTFLFHAASENLKRAASSEDTPLPVGIFPPMNMPAAPPHLQQLPPADIWKGA